MRVLVKEEDASDLLEEQMLNESTGITATQITQGYRACRDLPKVVHDTTVV